MSENFQVLRLPPTPDTLHFISPYFMLEHVREALDDRLKTPFGIFTLFDNILAGIVRVYGVFSELGNVFFGFWFGSLDVDGGFAIHTVFNRNTRPDLATAAAEQVAAADFAQSGIELESFVSFIPERNRAARLLARRAGYRDLGTRQDKVFMHNGIPETCREFRKYRR